MPTYSHNSGDSEPPRLAVDHSDDDAARLDDTTNDKVQRQQLRNNSASCHTMLVVLA